MKALQKHHLGFPLANFLIAALLGLFMRYTSISDIGFPFTYRYITHAHSHVAMLGWVYLALFILIVHHFSSGRQTKYRRLFWLTQVSAIGMLCSFPFQGYGAVSITFSSLHVLASYSFIYFIWKDTKTQSSAAATLLRASLLFMFLSTLGLWFMGLIMALKISGPWSQIPVQFFLHFQFNGWFIFAVIAILFQILRVSSSSDFNRFIVSLGLSIFFTFAWPLSWYLQSAVWWWLNALGIFLQLIALFYLMRIVLPKLKRYWQATARLNHRLLYFTLLCFVLKIFLQSLILIPDFAEKAYLYTNFIIGFIHLTMLGLISGFLLLYFLDLSLFIRRKSLVQTGIYLFIIGVTSTEIILFFQGVLFYFGKGMFSNYFLILFIASVILVLGIFFLFLQLCLKPTRRKTQSYYF